MSTVGSKSSPSGSVTSLDSENTLFDYPEADIVLRSSDSYEFRVLKLYIAHSSPKLGEKVLTSSTPLPSSSAEAHLGRDDGLPVVSLPVSGAILYSLLTYVFPVSPILPQTVEQTMELLSVAQEYEMDLVLTQIRNHIARQTPSFIRVETAFLVYSLAQKHGLRTEALQAAKSTLRFSNFTISNLHFIGKLDMMPGASLHELWKYHKRVRSKLKSCIEEFMTSHARGILGKSFCGSLTNSGVPSWLYRYIATIETAPVPLTSLGLAELYVHMATHIQKLSHKGSGGCSSCANTPGEKIHRFWEALTTAVDRNIAEAEIGFALIVDGGQANDQAGSSSKTAPPLKYLDMLNADVTLLSSDLVKFRVHKAALATSSPLFRDMFSLPQPSNDEPAGELPTVPLPEDAVVLNSLISMLYPVPPEIPKSHDAILALLSAAQKYDMVAVQSSVRAEASRRGLLSPPHAEAFRMYAIAYSRRLSPEMENAARLTLDYPLTFESLGVALRSFEGRALQDLADFRRRCTKSIPFQLMAFLDGHLGPSKIWVGCPTAPANERLPGWLQKMLRTKIVCLDDFTHTIPAPSRFDKEFLAAVQAHVNENDCHSCMKVFMLSGEAFCSKIKKTLGQMRNVPYQSSEGPPGL
ncbi:hypothetical protein BC826DRAFT_1107143 [Russula brevipes]|nr:hypothetical protein BC826DRAFT_1107143 [Russula brevipes]